VDTSGDSTEFLAGHRISARHRISLPGPDSSNDRRPLRLSSLATFHLNEVLSKERLGDIIAPMRKLRTLFSTLAAIAILATVTVPQTRLNAQGNGGGKNAPSTEPQIAKTSTN